MELMVALAATSIIAAATLSNRYISDRFLPDKAIDLVDEAASRLRMEVDSKPEEIDELDRKLVQLKIEETALQKETDKASQERLAKLKEQGSEAVWPEPARTNEHKRGEVRPMSNHTSTPHLHFPPRASAGAPSGARDGAALGRVLHSEVSQVQLIRRGF